MHGAARRVGSLKGFTLIELLVVVAVIAVLIGVLLPALGMARASSRAIVAANNLRGVAQAVTIYSGDADGYFPPSYVYATTPSGEDWNVEDQVLNNPDPTNGYVHWSWFLFESGSAGAEAFTSPGVLNGGAPRTNPGDNYEDWEPGQIDDVGRTIDNLPPTDNPYPEDRQVPRMAFTGNAAIFPRNKFSVPSPRKNQLVRASKINAQSRTILATEFAEAAQWQSLGDNDGGNARIKSHRSLNPFMVTQGGNQDAIYLQPPQTGNFEWFRYPYTGLSTEGSSEVQVLEQIGPGTLTTSACALSAVGRHHPGGTAEAKFGGSANFVFVDGHIERKNVVETIRERQWGDRFYSLTGDNRVNTDIAGQ